MDVLNYYSKVDITVFFAILFIYEGNQETSEEQSDALIKSTLPERFKKTKLKHEKINQEGDHFGVSRTAFKNIEVISEEKLEIILKVINQVTFNGIMMLNQIIVNFDSNLQPKRHVDKMKYYDQLIRLSNRVSVLKKYPKDKINTVYSIIYSSIIDSFSYSCGHLHHPLNEPISALLFTLLRSAPEEYDNKLSNSSSILLKKFSQYYF